jgi:hypothetical protein
MYCVKIERIMNTMGLEIQNTGSGKVSISQLIKTASEQVLTFVQEQRPLTLCCNFMISVCGYVRIHRE